MSASKSDASGSAESVKPNEQHERRKAQNRNAQKKFRSKKALEEANGCECQKHTRGSSTSCWRPACEQRPWSASPNPAASMTDTNVIQTIDSLFGSPPFLDPGCTSPSQNALYMSRIEQQLPSSLSLDGIPNVVNPAQNRPTSMSLQEFPISTNLGLMDLTPTTFNDSYSSSAVRSLVQESSLSRKPSFSLTHTSPEPSAPQLVDHPMMAPSIHHQNRFMPNFGEVIDTGHWNLTLHIAAEKGHESIVRVLLEHNVDVNDKDSSGSTALHLAARNKHDGVLRLLLEGGADVNAPNANGWTAAHEAAETGNAAALSLLLSHGASTTQRARSKV